MNEVGLPVTRCCAVLEGRKGSRQEFGRVVNASMMLAMAG